MKRGKSGGKQAKQGRSATGRGSAASRATAAPAQKAARNGAANGHARNGVKKTRPAAKHVAAPRPAARRAGKPAGLARHRPRPPLVQPVDLERQLADPVEAAQEDVRALPERPLFDRDDSGRDDDLAEMLGEEYVRSVTSGEEQGVELRDEPTPEEEGGPFLESSARREFSFEPDDAEPEPLPMARREGTKNLR